MWCLKCPESLQLPAQRWRLRPPQRHADSCLVHLMQAMLETEKDMDATRQRLHRLEEERCGTGPAAVVLSWPSLHVSARLTPSA